MAIGDSPEINAYPGRAGTKKNKLITKARKDENTKRRKEKL
jgi:hypothetical protein